VAIGCGLSRELRWVRGLLWSVLLWHTFVTADIRLVPRQMPISRRLRHRGVEVEARPCSGTGTGLPPSASRPRVTSGCGFSRDPSLGLMIAHACSWARCRDWPIWLNGIRHWRPHETKLSRPLRPATTGRQIVPAQRKMENGRSPLVSSPLFGRGFSRHGGLSIR
jgi:hypothetical protein